MKILICGWGRSGKDELATLLELLYKSSSETALDKVIWPGWGESRYATKEDCFNDRANHRQTWYERICDFNKDDRARLAKIIVETSECYVGMRDDREFLECQKQKVFDLTIWVDAEGRVPEEESCKVTKEMCDVTVMNRGTYKEYAGKTVPQIGAFIEGAKFAEKFAGGVDAFTSGISFMRDKVIIGEEM